MASPSSTPQPAGDDPTLGPLVRLWGLRASQLPAAGETPDGVAPLLISILQEAVPFIDTVAPKNSTDSRWWKPKGSSAKTFSAADCAAPVALFERRVDVAELERIAARSGQAGKKVEAAEVWSCRRSLHQDAAAKGTASWHEFRDCFKDRHVETEDAFTPSVVGARQAAVWDCGSVEAEEAGETWGHFTLSMAEMRHRIGRPVLKDRTFPVLQMTCAAMDKDAATDDAAAVSHREKPEFLVVSITVDDFLESAADDGGGTKGSVVAAYVSVERIRKLPATGEIEWIMATASDARGVLPKWMQAKAVPGQIAKDVFKFLVWIAQERAAKKNGEAATSEPPATASSQSAAPEPELPPLPLPLPTADPAPAPASVSA
ncbi:hypothetical protein B0T26DRAFT_760467 [Lasiosphaeria miniovina]|uniref:DUF3074 domain-containing protein n=1 Tax=Lasiosphaeria miniovina TaxID=1954250 RepID=A0AA40EA01_9PEZI|nr:uncharacterized protein B0T26DRAFT_760467 [Lasiosphaeria miniovina]KAK0733894.1 hypothetical protein B0T26DRAFT_760467 [Lasiosphaeria miniovina]